MSERETDWPTRALRSESERQGLLDALDRVMSTLSHAAATPEERATYDAAYAELAKHGRGAAAELERYRAAWERREAK